MTEAAVAASPDQQRSRGPFLMPDGRPLDLSSFLDSQQQLRPPRGSSHSSRRPGAIKEPKQGWTKAVPHAAATSASAVVSSEAEQAEMYALSRVGHRKQRRWLNDKLLRDMAGALTAADMASLFKPAPFGETRTSLWEQAAQPEHAVLWNYFRSVEMDKQGRVLEKWQSHVRELQARPAVVHNPAVDALTAWACVNWKARQAMKRAGPCFVQATEDQVLSFLEDDGAGDEMVVSGLEDGFHRLIAHGLAEFHGMPSHSRVREDGSKEVVVRRRTQATAAGAIVAQVSRSAAHAVGGGAWTDEDVAPMTPAAQPGRWPVAIACSDILQLLADGPHQPMSAAVLRQAYLQPDSSSDAGDHRYPPQPPQDQEQI